MLFSEMTNVVGDSFMTLTPSGAFANVFVVGASFRVSGERLVPQEPPLPLLAANVGSNEYDCTMYELEYSPPKPNGDLLFLRPLAVSRDGQPARKFDVTIRVGDFRRDIVAVGPWSARCTALNIRATQPALVTEVSLGFENGFGGKAMTRDQTILNFHEENPVGKGLPIVHGVRGIHPCPQIFWKGEESVFAAWGAVQPVGLTCVNRSWMPRRQHAGTYDAEWRARFPLFPNDFNQQFENVAHERLQFPKQSFLDSIEVVGMSTENFRFKLGSYGVLFLAAEGQANDYVSVLPDTLLLDCQSRIVHARWRTHVPPSWHKKVVVCKSLHEIRSDVSL